MGKLVIAMVVGLAMVGCAEQRELADGTSRGVEVSAKAPEVEELPPVQSSAVLLPAAEPVEPSAPAPEPEELEPTSETMPEPEEVPEPAPMPEPAIVSALETLARPMTAYEAQVARVVGTVGADMGYPVVDKSCFEQLKMVQAPDAAAYAAYVGEQAAEHSQGALVGAYVVLAPSVTLDTVGQPLTHAAIHRYLACAGLADADHSLEGAWSVPGVEDLHTLEAMSERWVTRIKLCTALCGPPPGAQ